MAASDLHARARGVGIIFLPPPRQRRKALHGGQGVITVHPSYLLRLQEERDKRREFDRLVKDLRFAAEVARKARR